MQKITRQDNVNEKDLADSCGDISLAIDYQQGINLLPYEFRREKIEKVQKVSLRWVVIIVFLLLGVSYLFSRAQISAYRSQLNNASLHLAAIAQVRQDKTNIDEFKIFYNSLKKSEFPSEKLLKALSTFSPRELFLNDFSFDSTSKTGSFQGFIKSAGEDPSAILAKFVNQLADSSYFIDLAIASVKNYKDTGSEVAEFKISFKTP